jgi:hypothetical protein
MNKLMEVIPGSEYSHSAISGETKRNHPNNYQERSIIHSEKHKLGTPARSLKGSGKYSPSETLLITRLILSNAGHLRGYLAFRIITVTCKEDFVKAVHPKNFPRKRSS